MDLYLVRHAIAGDADPSRWPNDSDRPLTPAGEKRFRRAARGLGRIVPKVDVVLSSTFARA
jgi:phosphohistidine phosphatase